MNDVRVLRCKVDGVRGLFLVSNYDLKCKGRKAWVR